MERAVAGERIVVTYRGAPRVTVAAAAERAPATRREGGSAPPAAIAGRPHGALSLAPRRPRGLPRPHNGHHKGDRRRFPGGA
jgi:antitoxin (DNA-binding transcriptional repressor) of toxin-antitoxin stability system